MTIVAIIGCDGCGKTTQAKMIVDKLRKEGQEAIYVRPVFLLLNAVNGVFRKDEDSFFIRPRKIRVSQYSSSENNGSFVKKMLGVSAGYFYGITTYAFMKFLSRNKIVVCDRYFYQFFFDLYGKSSRKIIRIFPKPDIAFFLRGDLEIFYSRMEASDSSIDKKYYEEIINMYEVLSEKYGFVQVDAKLNKEVINNILFMHLTKKMKGVVL